jgi:hypothetical protein
VIETSTVGYTAESDQLHALPELGALVRVGGLTDTISYYGVVAFGATGGLDTSRKAVRRGGHDLMDEAIYERHPELELVLRTLFSVAVVGYRDGITPRHVLPALPAPLHYTVHACDAAEAVTFCDEPRYFATLLNYNGDVSAEQLIASHLRWVDAQLADNHAWLEEATRRLARLMKRDYDRLVTILQAIEPD